MYFPSLALKEILRGASHLRIRTEPIGQAYRGATLQADDVDLTSSRRSGAHIRDSGAVPADREVPKGPSLVCQLGGDPILDPDTPEIGVSFPLVPKEDRSAVRRPCHPHSAVTVADVGVHVYALDISAAHIQQVNVALITIPELGFPHGVKRDRAPVGRPDGCAHDVKTRGEFAIDPGFRFHQPHVVGPGLAAIAYVRNRASVRRPHRRPAKLVPGVGLARNLLDGSRFHVRHEHVLVSRSIRKESDSAPQGTPGEGTLAFRITGDPAEILSIPVDDPDVLRALSGPEEGDSPSVGRPYW